MLSLDDHRWSFLTHAYGSASDIPDFLKALKLSPSPDDGSRPEPWFTLWSSLCHQDDVYNASYAAVPHIVRIGCEASETLDFSFFQLPACVEVARQNGRGPELPDELKASYIEAIAKLADCVCQHRNDKWDDATTLSALAALAASKGQFRIAEAIINLDADIIEKVINLDFN